jgi:hypothetical protein
MEIKLPRPSELVNCENIVSCFQAFYNLFFAILILLAFVYFIYGALQYLLSGAKVYSKEEGKKKMINSVVAVILALAIPIILNMINPGIFKAQLKLPVIKVDPVLYTYYGEQHTITDPDCPTGNQNVKKIDRFYMVSLSSVGFKNIKADSGVCANLQILPYLCKLDKSLSESKGEINPFPQPIKITSGYSKNHDNACHTGSGRCVDIVIEQGFGSLNEACSSYLALSRFLQNAGANTIVFETKAKEEQLNRCTDVVKDMECAYEHFWYETIETGQGFGHTQQRRSGKIKNKVTWKQCPKTTGTHLHVEFFPMNENELGKYLNITEENGVKKAVQCKQ